MAFKSAQSYTVGETVPKNYPWDLTHAVIKSITTMEDGRLKIESSDRRVLLAAPNELLTFPRRIKGDPNSKIGSQEIEERFVDWKRDLDIVPVTFMLVYGDIAPGVDGKKYRCVGMRQLSPMNLNEVIVEFEEVISGEIRYERCKRMGAVIVGSNPHFPTQGESPVQRAVQPWRGPYTDRRVSEDPDHIVVYYFAVHPTGRGRWSDDVDLYTPEITHGVYRTRPPKRASEFAVLKFGSTDDTKRHPNDPLYVKPRD